MSLFSFFYIDISVAFIKTFYIQFLSFNSIYQVSWPKQCNLPVIPHKYATGSSAPSNCFKTLYISIKYVLKNVINVFSAS
jgi:hypothetical protein